MTDGFSVTPAELRDHAAVISELLNDCANQPATKYWSDPAEFGDDDLAAALSEFQQTSSEIFVALLADSTELAARLDSTATAYELADADVADVITRVHQR